MTRRDVEHVEVPDGEGLISVGGRAEASVLVLAGDPVAVGGYCDGSIGVIAARARDPRTALAEVKSLAAWLAAPGPGAADLAERLRPLLGLLRPGRYALWTARSRDVDIMEEDLRWWMDDEDAPPLTLLPTDAWPPRDRAMVAHYQRRLETDEPALVALLPETDSPVGYLIDGHHKLLAYRRAGLTPPVVCLAPDPPLRPLREEVEHLQGDLAGKGLSWGDPHWDEVVAVARDVRAFALGR